MHLCLSLALPAAAITARTNRVVQKYAIAVEYWVFQLFRLALYIRELLLSDSLESSDPQIYVPGHAIGIYI